MRIVLEERKLARSREVQASVATIQDYEVRTPLQRAVQLLKRHRDMRYGGDADKPISIIITTLAASVYANEPTLLQTLTAIIPQMRSELHRQKRGEEWWVANPANPMENFADKWKETPRKAEVFLEWLDRMEEEFGDLASGFGFDKIGDYLTEAYGSRETSAALTRYANRKKPTGIVRLGIARISLPESVRELTSLAVPHCQPPPWQTVPFGTVTVSAEWRKAGPWKQMQSGRTNVVTSTTIMFHAFTNVPRPYQVFWQVVNTGKAARDRRDLRGDIFAATNAAAPLEHAETTRYRGRHWIECFIVQGGICVARSGALIVNIV